MNIEVELLKERIDRETEMADAAKDESVRAMHLRFANRCRSDLWLRLQERGNR